MTDIDSTLISKILDWGVAVVAVGVLGMLKKLVGHDRALSNLQMQTALCEQRDALAEKQREQEQARRDKQREEVLELLRTSHEEQVAAIRDLSIKIDTMG